MIAVIITQMDITIDMEGMRIGVGEIMGQTVITGITWDIGNTMIRIDGGVEMDGEKFSYREKLLRRMADTMGGENFENDVEENGPIVGRKQETEGGRR